MTYIERAVLAFANINHGLSFDSAVAAVEDLLPVVGDNKDLIQAAFDYGRALQAVIVEQDLEIIKALRNR